MITSEWLEIKRRVTHMGEDISARCEGEFRDLVLTACQTFCAQKEPARPGDLHQRQLGRIQLEHRLASIIEAHEASKSFPESRKKLLSRLNDWECPSR